MTTLRKPDGAETLSILETVNIMLDHFITTTEEKKLISIKRKEDDRGTNSYL
jgi:hypothetical protein